MSYGVRLHAWGERACFTRPEMKVERVSYDVMTPSAARGLIEAIYWKPAICWVIDRIHVLKPIRFQSFRRNEVSEKISTEIARRGMQACSVAGLGLDISEQRFAPEGAKLKFRQQRATLLLTHVAYVIEAHFELTERAGSDDDPAKHAAMFTRRAEKGQCFHRPCLGAREFPADFALLPEGAPLPASELPADQRDRDLGWMLHDIDFRADGTARQSRFFRARLTGGVLDVRACLDAEGMAA